MEEKGKIKLILSLIIIIIILIAIIIGLIIFRFIEKEQTEKNVNQTNTAQNNTSNSEQGNTDYFVLFNGREISKTVGEQELTDMEINTVNNKKYTTTYFNYENNEYLGETQGTFGTETYENVSVVSNVKRIATSKKYNAIPRKAQVLGELPKQLIDMSDYTDVKVMSIDLDGDSSQEYIVAWEVNYNKNEIAEGEQQTSSGIMLFNSNFKKISDIVTLDNGFWGNIKDEEHKIFITLDKIDCFDVDNDGIMEIIIDEPTYEGDKINILKYSNGELKGSSNVEASVQS